MAVKEMQSGPELLKQLIEDAYEHSSNKPEKSGHRDIAMITWNYFHKQKISFEQYALLVKEIYKSIEQ